MSDIPIITKMTSDERDRAMRKGFKLMYNAGYKYDDFVDEDCFVIRFSDGTYSGFYHHIDGRRLSNNFNLEKAPNKCNSIW